VFCSPQDVIVKMEYAYILAENRMLEDDKELEQATVVSAVVSSFLQI